MKGERRGARSGPASTGRRRRLGTLLGASSLLLAGAGGPPAATEGVTEQTREILLGANAEHWVSLVLYTTHGQNASAQKVAVRTTPLSVGARPSAEHVLYEHYLVPPEGWDPESAPPPGSGEELVARLREDLVLAYAEPLPREVRVESGCVVLGSGAVRDTLLSETELGPVARRVGVRVVEHLAIRLESRTLRFLVLEHRGPFAYSPWSRVVVPVPAGRVEAALARPAVPR